MPPPFRNYPPNHGIRVPADILSGFAESLLRTCGMDADGAGLVAGALVASDLRCVFSHGTKSLEEYLPKLRSGEVNPRPQVRVERDEGATAIIDGDGGLGYHACNVGMGLAVARARQFGVGAVTTYHHHHMGAAGTWTRMALEKNCVGMAISGHRFEPEPGEVVAAAARSSPISFAVPAGEQPPLVLDMGATFLPRTEELMREFPRAFFKSLGIGTVNLVLGGILAGIWRPETQPPGSPWAADQGSFLTAWHVARFMDVDKFKAEMDRHMYRARKLEPLPGFRRAELPGGMEFTWERENATRGIPLSDEHCELLSGLADGAAMKSPWEEYEQTRF